MTVIDRSRLADLTDRIRLDLANGEITAAQVAVGLHGAVVVFEAFGTATTHDRFVVFSATKPLTAMALLPHFADGTLQLTAPVAAYLPEFGHHGKGDVTVLQLLTMQGGFPQAPIEPDRWGTSAGRRAQFAEWPLAWPAGTRTEYHPVAAHWVIAELLQALNGRNYLDVVNDRVFQPAGVGPLLGPEVSTAVTVRAHGTYPPDTADLVATFGRPDLVPISTIGPDALLTMNIRSVQTAGIPGGGAIARADEMALVYQQFLHNRGGALPDDWLADALSTVRNGSINVSDGVPANRTIAGYVSGHDGYHLHRWMPPAPRAFGHTGAGGQLCWVDPASGLSFSFLNDTLHQDPRVEFRRAAALNHLALGLVHA
ncbi:MAG: serine hydrolase domain-containing protein [Actinomycetota bacterium]|nr:serine hydrolase domain-containing protein [Actinomycetota bacterium]